jgi:tetratricopeptide (TPR) repeat protein
MSTSAARGQFKPAPARAKSAGPSKTKPASRSAFWTKASSRQGLWLAAIVAATGIVYLRCLGNGYVFDDHEMIILNRYIGDWSFLWKALVNDSWWFRDPAHLPQSHYYRPLQDIWLGLNYQAFGLNPIGPHALMVGLHLAAVVFAYLIAARLAGDSFAGLAAALLFGVLPVHAEAVIWATAIPESLAGTLQLSAFYFYLRYRDEGWRSGLVMALAMFGGALLSHESAIAFPVLVAAHEFLLRRTDPHPSPLPGQGEGTDKAGGGILNNVRQAVFVALPFVLVAIVYLGLRFAVLGFIAKRDVNNQATLAQILLTVPTVIVHNLADIIYPFQAGPSHRIIWINSPLSPDFWMPVAGLLLIAAAGLVAIADSPHRNAYLFSVAWVFIPMLPVLNLGILYPNALVADRYLYFSSFGFCLLMGEVVAAIARSNPAWTRPVGAAVGAVAVVYALMLWHVQHFWHDEIALFGRCIERFPDSGFCHNRLGMALQGVGDLKGAEHELTTAFRLDPGDYAAEYDLGMVHARQGLYAQAARENADALKHLPNPPVSAWVELGELYGAAHDNSASEAAFAQAEKFPGGRFEVALARARNSLAHKDASAAQRQLEKLLAAAPDDPRALLMLGSAMALQNRYDDALAAYQHALRVVPGDVTVRFLAALTLHNLGRDREALTQCQLVLRAAPSNPNAQALLRLIERGLSSRPAGGSPG